VRIGAGPGDRAHAEVLPADWHPGIAVIDHLEPGRITMIIGRAVTRLDVR
jgi:hypothetical protein